MVTFQKLAASSLLIAGLAGLAACGSSGSTSSVSGGATAGSSTQASSSAASKSSASGGAGALSADARSAATGDIPDNQVFLTFSSPAAGFAIKYPEGWTQSRHGHEVTFRDKNNLVHIVTSAGPAPTPASLKSELKRLANGGHSLTYTLQAPLSLPAGRAVRAIYTTQSAPNPVTGRRVTLIVKRYELSRGARVAVVDLGTPRGVDNVDAYRMMINSFRWR